MKLHRKIKHNEKVCHTQELASYAQGQWSNCAPNHVSAVTYKLHTKANLMKLHRKIKHNEKVRQACTGVTF